MEAPPVTRPSVLACTQPAGTLFFTSPSGGTLYRLAHRGDTMLACPVYGHEASRTLSEAQVVWLATVAPPQP